jgi:GcrA cell cycle regulator
MDWTDEVIERLKVLWAEGHSTAEIGRRMGVSKNAVVGKAHRLALPARPSPIRRVAAGDAPRRATPRRVVGPTLPSLNAPIAEPPPVAAVRAPPVALRAVARQGGGRLVACCWPIGEPGTRSFRFCDAVAATGKPYCAEHAALAYVKVRDRREEAA